MLPVNIFNEEEHTSPMAREIQWACVRTLHVINLNFLSLMIMMEPVFEQQSSPPEKMMVIHLLDFSIDNNA